MAEEFDPVMDIPCATDLGVPEKQMEEYEGLLYAYWQHSNDKDSDEYLNPIIVFLKSIKKPTDVVKLVWEKLRASGRLEDAFSGSDLDIASAKDLGMNASEFLGEPFEKLDIVEGKEAQFNEGEEQGSQSDDDDKGKRSRRFKLHSSLNYTKEYADVIITVGEGEERVEFKVHSVILCEQSSVFEDWYKAQESVTGTPVYLETVNIDPKALDTVLSWIYGDPFSIEDTREENGELQRMIYKVLSLADELRLEKFVIEVTEAFGELSKIWNTDVVEFIVDLYRYHLIRNTGVRIPTKHLENMVRCIRESRRMQLLCKILDKQPKDEAAADFFRDLSYALCKVLSRSQPIKTKVNRNKVPNDTLTADMISLPRSPEMVSLPPSPEVSTQQKKT